MAASNTSIQYDDGTRYVFCGTALKYDPATGRMSFTTPITSASYSAAVGAASNPPTQAEVNAIITVLNQLITDLKTSGLIAAP